MGTQTARRKPAERQPSTSGDKRTQHVYDLDDVGDESVIDELVATPYVQTFGPDTLPEARNRGYRLRRV